MSQLIELETERLRLRQWCEADLAPFAKLNGDPKAMKYFPTTLQPAESDRLAQRCKQLIAERGWGFWATELKQTEQFIGFIGLHIPPSDLPCSPCVEVGWRLLPDFWGNGFATEAARASVDLGFERLSLPKIVSFTAIGNAASRAVMERLQMSYVGTFEHPNVPVETGLRLHCWYELTREQWAVRSGNLQL